MRNMRLKIRILEYVGEKDKVRLRDLLCWLNEGKGRTTYGIRKVAGNLNALGWRQENRGDDLYLKIREPWEW